MNTLENSILKSFIKYMKNEVNNLDLFVSLPDEETWDEEKECVVMEKQDNGRVWNVICNKNNKVIDVYEL